MANLAKIIPEGKASISNDFGKFISYGKIYTAEQKQLGVTYAVVQMNLSYENVSVTYTISFDEDMKLIREENVDSCVENNIRENYLFCNKSSGLDD